MLPPLLFNKYDVFSVLEAQKEGAKKAIRSAPESLLKSSEDDAVAHFIEAFGIQIPTLVENRKYVTEQEVEVDVSRDYRRAIMDTSRPFLVMGTEVTVHIPFEGEAVFFDVRPSTFTLSPPRGLIAGNELRLVYSFPNDSPPPNLKADLDRNTSEIRTYLDRLREGRASFDQQLPGLVRSEVQQRQQQFTNKAGLLAGLGLPMASRPSSSFQPASSTSLGRTSEGRSSGAARLETFDAAQTNWRVFISHASEDKELIAKPLADALIAAGISVWYDDYTLRVGDSLRKKIDEGLGKSQFGIVILSKCFFGKHWPEQELNGLAAREVNGKKVILPVWHDVSRDEVLAASPVLADRLGVLTSMGLDKVVSELLRAME